MLRTTLHQLGSVTGRAILAIGLTSATVLALAPSAKADSGVVTLTNPVVQSATYTQPATLTPTFTSGMFTDVAAGSLAVFSNDSTGYSISASSGNGAEVGKLRKGSTGGSAIAYELRLQHASLSGTDGYKSLATTQRLWNTTALATGSGETLNVQLKITEDARNVQSGNYSDTITFSIAAKQ